MKRFQTALLLALLGSIACGKKTPPPATTPESALQKTVKDVPTTPPCSRIIPQEWNASYPLPALQDGHLVYRIFFYGWEGGPKTGIKRHRAEGDAVFSPDGKILTCSQRGRTPAVFPDETRPGMTNDEYEELDRKLFTAIETMSSWYAAGKPLDAAQKRKIGDFSSDFSAQSAHGHAADYLALNPGFWSWVEENGAAAPKP